MSDRSFELRPSDSASQADVNDATVSAMGSVLAPPANPFHIFSDLSSMSEAQVGVFQRVADRYYDSYSSYCMLTQQSSTNSGICAEVVGSSFSGSGVESALSGSLESSVRPAVVSKSRLSAASSLPSGFSLMTTGSKSKVRSAARASRWKQRHVLSKSLPVGFCYSRLFRPEARQSVAGDLMAFPTLGDVLSQPADVAVSTSLLSDLAIVKAGNAYHLDVVGRSSTEYVLAVPALVDLARRSEFPLGSLGYQLCRNSRVFGSKLKFVLELDDRLGGDSLCKVSQQFSKLCVDSCVLSPKSTIVDTRVTQGLSVVKTCFSDLAEVAGTRVFLAGSNEKDCTYGWRAKVLSSLSVYRCEVFVPKVASVFPSSALLPGGHLEAQKIDWEHQAIAASEYVVFNFVEGTQSSISLLELGLLAPTSKCVVVVCPREYSRSAHVAAVCERNHFSWFYTLSEAVDKLDLYFSMRTLSLSHGLALTASLPGLVYKPRFDSVDVCGCHVNNTFNAPLSVCGWLGWFAAPSPFPLWARDSYLQQCHYDDVKHRGQVVFQPQSVTPVLSLDCEAVSVASELGRRRNVLGRVSVINEYGQTVYDAFVRRSGLDVVNTNLKYGSGICWEDIDLRSSGCVEFVDAIGVLQTLLRGKVLVGYDVQHDIKYLEGVTNVCAEVVDVQKLVSNRSYKGLGDSGGKIGLAAAVQYVFGCSVQTSPSGHSSVEDAVATMALYRLHRNFNDEVLKEYYQRVRPSC